MALVTNNPNKTLVSLLEANLETTQGLEQLYSEANYSDLEFGEIAYSQKHAELNKWVTDYLKFQQDLSKVNVAKLESSAQKDFQDIYTKVSTNAKAYQAMIPLYNQAYEAYTTGSIEPMANAKDSDDKNAQIAYGRMQQFLENRDYWKEKLEANKCSEVANAQLVVCEQANEYFNQAYDSIETSTSIVRAIFGISSESEAVTSNFVSSEIEKLIEVLK